MPLASGQVIQNGRYRIVNILGQGGMGAVYKAWHIDLKIPVAVKENLDASPEAQRQFGREAQMLALLSYPNLPRVMDYFFLPGQGQYLVMDFVEGEDLGTMLQRRGALPEAEVIPWIIQVCEALSYLHGQNPPIIHRDIKPGNIKIRPNGRAMLVDFGIAKIYDPLISTTLGARAVTPGYSPPEQYGGGKTDARSDIYALGATLYHLLTNQLPQESVSLIALGEKLEAPRSLNNGISVKTEQVILHCIELEANRRFQTIDELRAVLTETEMDTARQTALPLSITIPESQTATDNITTTIQIGTKPGWRDKIKKSDIFWSCIIPGFVGLTFFGGWDYRSFQSGDHFKEFLRGFIPFWIAGSITAFFGVAACSIFDESPITIHGRWWKKIRRSDLLWGGIIGGSVWLVGFAICNISIAVYSEHVDIGDSWQFWLITFFIVWLMGAISGAISIIIGRLTNLNINRMMKVGAFLVSPYFLLWVIMGENLMIGGVFGIILMTILFSFATALIPPAITKVIEMERSWLIKQP